MSKEERFSHLSFDCYGTLIDWRKGIRDSLGALFSQSGIAVSEDVFEAYVATEAKEEKSQYRLYRSILKSTAIELARKYGARVSDTDAESFAASVPRWPAFDDTVRTLKDLGKKGITRVILSNVDRDLLAETISRARLEVDGTITAEDVRSYKPRPGHWTRFLKEYGPDKRRVLHVAGSTYHDISPAQRLGFSTAWVNRYNEANPGGVKPTYVLRDLGELLDILE